MDPEIDDHYRVLGLPSGAKLSEKEISKAYKQKALLLHPDKRPDDPNAHDNFQKLKNSYEEILKDETARKDKLKRVGGEKQDGDRQFEAKRQRKVSDLERREKGEFSAERKAREEEEKIKRKLQEEIACIRATHAKSKVSQTKQDEVAKQGSGRSENVSGAVAAAAALDKTKVLKVIWEKGIGDYSASWLRELFQEFGGVEDVVINSSNKKTGSALVVMAFKEVAVAATGSLIGHLSNLLCVVPFQPATASNLNLGGLGHQAFENSVLDKLRKAAQKQSKLI